jgi:serine/threonine-protein kinase
MSGDPRRIDALIESIADGNPVDWDALEASAANDSERRVLRHLRLVANVAEVHRTILSDPAPDDQPIGSSPALMEIGEVGQAIPRWGHLLLLDKIGEGTFGEVYRARDPWLDREVALKLVKPGVSIPAARILHEAQTLARVRHPNVVMVHGADMHDGRVGLWMEFVRGRTVGQVLASQGPFSASEAALIGQELCRALAAVHRAGLVHRDIKSQNVMRESGGRLVLMDFGAGELVEGPQAARPAGTPLYLAPEVLEGGQATVQADIYSLGVLLYHLATGTFPATGTSIEELRLAHERGALRRLRDVRPELPDTFVAVVDKALDHNPSRRFASAGDMQHALARVTSPGLSGYMRAIAAERIEQRPRPRPWREIAVAVAVVLAIAAALITATCLYTRPPPPAATRGINLVAVMPLVGAAGEPEYFAEGLTEALMQELAGLESLRVISQTSVNQAWRTEKTLPAIAKALNADAILEGSVANERKQVRVSLRLIHAGSDTPVWTRTFEQSLENVFALQREVARSVARELSVALSKPAEAPKATNVQAFDAYLRGSYYLGTVTASSQRQALAYFKETLGHDPAHARAHAGIAQVYLILGGSLGAMPRDEGFRLARESVRRALDVDNDLAEAHAVLGEISFEYDWDWTAAEREYLRALTLNPSLEWARERYAMFLVARGRTDAALSEIELARQVDPLSPVIASTAGAILRYSRRYENAVEQYRKVLAAHPDHLRAHVGLARTLNVMGRHDEALALYRAMKGPNPGLILAEIAIAEAGAGRRDAAVEALRQLQRNEAQAGWVVSPDSYAYVYARLGQIDEAFRWLEEAFKIREGGVLWLNVDARVDPLRADPRFAGYLRRLGLTP